VNCFAPFWVWQSFYSNNRPRTEFEIIFKEKTSYHTRTVHTHTIKPNCCECIKNWNSLFVCMLHVCTLFSLDEWKKAKKKKQCKHTLTVWRPLHSPLLVRVIIWWQNEVHKSIQSVYIWQWWIWRDSKRRNRDWKGQSLQLEKPILIVHSLSLSNSLYGEFSEWVRERVL